MGFSKEFVDKASKKIISKSADSDYKFIVPKIEEAIKNVAEAFPFFDPIDVNVYLAGSYQSGLNIAFQSKIEVIVEVTKTNELDLLKLEPSNFKLYDNFYVGYYDKFNVKKFKAALIQAMEIETKQKITESAVNFLVPAYDKLQHDIEILPVFSYKYFGPAGESVDGFLAYDSEIDEYFMAFNNLSQDNGIRKDKVTNGKFKEMVRLFKTITGISGRESGAIHPVRGYFIESLLFNVPNEMFFSANGDNLSVFLKIINWLNFANFDEFICPNQVWSLWGDADGFWQQSEAKKFVTEVIKFYGDFASNRKEIIID